MRKLWLACRDEHRSVWVGFRGYPKSNPQGAGLKKFNPQPACFHCNPTGFGFAVWGGFACGSGLNPIGLWAQIELILIGFFLSKKCSKLIFAG